MQRRSGSRSDRFEAPPETASWDLGYYLGALKKRWWLILALGVMGLGFAWWSERNAVPTYTAEALLQQRSEAPFISQGILGQSGGEEFASHLEIIRSRAVLRAVVDSLALQLRIEGPEVRRTELFEFVHLEPEGARGYYTLRSAGGSVVLEAGDPPRALGRFAPGDTIAGPGFQLGLAPSARLSEPLVFAFSDPERATVRLRNRLRIEQGMGRDLIWIRISDPDPEHAAALVNAVSNEYRRYRANRARQIAARRRGVIADQLVQLADSLRRVQDRVLEYQRSRALLNPEVESNALLRERLDLQAELREFRFKESMLATLVAELRTTGPNDELQQRLLAFGNDVIPGGAALQQRLQGLVDQREQLTASRFGYTENAPQVQRLDAQIASAKEQMRVAAEESLELLEAQIGRLQSRLGEVQVGVGTAPGVSVDLTRLQQRVDAVQEVYDLLVEEYYQAQIAEGVEAGDVAVVDPATVPLYPDPSRAPLRMTFALLAGLMIGAVGALTLEQFDHSVHSVSEAERAARIPVLGTVPRIRSRSTDALEMRAGKEAFRSIRTNLMFAREREPKLLAITSAEPAEGKSTVAANLALALAEQGVSVVLVDADLRRPRIHELFGLPKAPGLSEVLTGTRDLDSVLRRHPQLSNLHVVAGGRVLESAPELLGGDAFSRVVSELEARFEVVLVDTAPVLAFTDAAVISLVADGTIIVARAERTNQDTLRDAVQKLRRVNAPLIGIVLNAMPMDGASAYYYEYYQDGGNGGSRLPRLRKPNRDSELAS